MYQSAIDGLSVVNRLIGWSDPGPASAASQASVQIEQGRVERPGGWWSRDAGQWPKDTDATEIYAGIALSNV
jgi:hypothetical protein